MQDRGFRWAIAGLALLGTVATGMLIGQDASADIAPFYGNMAIIPDHGRATDLALASTDRSGSATGIADASDGRGGEGATY